MKNHQYLSACILAFGVLAAIGFALLKSGLFDHAADDSPQQHSATHEAPSHANLQDDEVVDRPQDSAMPSPVAASTPYPAPQDYQPAGGKVSSAGGAMDSQNNEASSANSPSVSRQAAVPVSGGGSQMDAVAARLSPFSTADALLENADLSNADERAYVVARMSEIEEARYDAVLARADDSGIPVRIDGPGNRVSILHDFRDDGQPVYRRTQNANAAISSGANLVQAAPYNLSGNGIKVGVWDAGAVRNTHRELGTSRVIKRNNVAIDDHATHVAGTIGAFGVSASAKGSAPGAAIDSWDWNNDYSEMTSSGAATPSGAADKIPLSNHSYGYNAVTSDMGRYNSESRQTDLLATAMPYYLICWAAGNEQAELTAKGGYQSITYNGLSKNVLTVGAVNDAVTSGTRNLSQATMSFFSSWGPVDDGRIKPDVVANGVTVFSPIDTNDSAYATYSGTSMATPSVAGSAANLAELYAREFSGQRMPASMLKGLLIHTADDLGNPGPDYKFGWGLINTKAAADVILAHKASQASPKMLEGTVTASEKVRAHTFQWDGVSPIRATLSWTDPAGTAQVDNSRTPTLRHNLDLIVTAPNGTTVYRPFVMPFVGNWSDAAMATNATTGKNNVDNVEQVFLAAPTQAGSYTVTVSLDGSLTTSTQAYSLIVTGGMNMAANPPPVVTLESPADGAVVLADEQILIAAAATDLTLEGASGVVQSVEFFVNGTSVGVDTTAPYSTNWTAPSVGSFAISARATDNEGASASSSPSTVFVLAGDGSPVISSITPASGTSGDQAVITGNNFAGVSSVILNGVEAAFSTNSLTQITFTIPAAASTGLVVVTNTYGSAQSPQNFTVVQSPVLISQVYGAGGNSGAVFNADYVELYNRGETPVDLAGWSIQYASASGTTWAVGNVSGSVAPGKYHLIRLAGGSSGSNLPAPDSIPGTSINMSGTQGKVALRNSTIAFGGSSPIGQSGLQDFVGYGTSNAYEGAGAAPAPSSTTAIFRIDGGTTDTGNNAGDFVVGTPNPRNSSSGTAGAPEISSPTSAAGLVGGDFSYQITASNSPTSFAAAGLPHGLSVNTATGLISGTPSAPGVVSATVSATNASGTGSASVTITITEGGTPGTSYIVDFEDASKARYASGDVTLNGISWNMTEALIGADAADFKNGTRSARLRGYGTSSITMQSDKPGGLGAISLQHKRYGTDTQVEWIVEYSINGGSNWVEAGRFTAGASVATFSSEINQPGPARIRLRTTATGTSNRRTNVDDITLGNYSIPVPALQLTGSLSVLNATYGSPSLTPTPFAVSGQNLTSPVVLSVPDAFEISLNGNAYFSTLDLGGAGSLASTTVFLRLAAGSPAGFYGGAVLGATTGASDVTLVIPESEVRKKILVITSDDREKNFGQVLNLGSGATSFSAAGLVGTESVGSVTLSANGGTDAYADPGRYEIMPSAATGGTFQPENYAITYIPGELRVLGISFGDWAASLPDPEPGGDPDNDGISNLLEYFFASDPNENDGTAATNLALDGSNLLYEYRRNKGMSAVAGFVEWSYDLGREAVWSTTGVSDVKASDHGSYEMRRATVPLGENEKRKFLRLRVQTEDSPPDTLRSTQN